MPLHLNQAGQAYICGLMGAVTMIATKTIVARVRSMSSVISESKVDGRCHCVNNIEGIPDVCILRAAGFFWSLNSNTESD